MNLITMMCTLFFSMMTPSMGEELTCPVTHTPTFITPATSITSTNTKIFMGNIKSLTFVQGEMTTSHRTPSIPQMTCLGEECYMEPKEITCKNLGLSENDYVWKCDSSMLPGKFSIIMADVNCEGYSHKEDPLITEGSCGITFRIGEVPLIPIIIIFGLLCLLLFCFPEFIFIAFISVCVSALLDGDSDDNSISFGASTSRR